MKIKNTLGKILMGASALALLGGCGFNKADERFHRVIKEGEINGARIIYGISPRTDRNSYSNNGLHYPRNEKMLVKYDNGITITLYDSNRDGLVDGTTLFFDKNRAQHLYDSLKTQLGIREEEK